MDRRAVALRITLITMLGLMIIGCAKKGEQFGDAPSGSAAKTAIASILLEPDKYLDKEVITEGRIISECPSGCNIVVRDASGGTIFVEMRGNSFIPLPQRVGKTVLVKGTVYQGQGSDKENKIFAKGLIIQ
jgi:hypothetical protein